MTQGVQDIDVLEASYFAGIRLGRQPLVIERNTPSPRSLVEDRCEIGPACEVIIRCKDLDIALADIVLFTHVGGANTYAVE